MKRILRFALVAVTMLLTVALTAQVTTSSMTGKINGSDGTLPGATVVVKHIPSGTVYGTTTNTDGRFNIQGMRVGGPYKVDVSFIGYHPASYENISLRLSETFVLNVTLIEDTKALSGVEVVDYVSLSTEDKGSVTSIDEEEIKRIPTVSRSLNDIMSLTPQASTTTNGFAVGGGNYRSSYVSVDGAAFNNAFGIGSNLPAGGTPISLDALEQIAVSITPFDVRQSGFTGGSIQATTKSGTNDFHATVYDYFTNQKLMGTKYGNKDDEDKYKELTLSESLNNTIGVSVGGPIIQDKLFFFVNFEYEADNDPGQSRLARENETDEWGKGTQYNRPTVSSMNEIKHYLAETYGYDPGKYQDYSISTPDYKFLARLDWNINKTNSINVRFSKTMNKYSSSPSSSINPLSSKTYDRNNYGRTSNSALYFESSRYFQEQNFTSIAGEWRSSYLDGKMNNLLRYTYSKQNEPRSYVGDLFPTVDILAPEEDGTMSVYTSFGLDPFTYGNLRDVSTHVVTDELTYQAGNHNLLAGIQLEFDEAQNGYMQGGAGFYVYNSWEDFVNDATPAAFAITHGNNNALDQVYPSFKYRQYSLYLQDNWSISDNFDLTYGIRFELPTYPSLDNNFNKEFDDLNINDKDGNHLSTSNMPKAKINFSPRVGFNWDILGDRSLILRGGTGIYTGRIPFVWIVSAMGNSNVMQAQYIADAATGLTPIHFHKDIPEMLKEVYGGTFVQQDLPAPTSTTILSENLKMPQTWKTSLALDIKLPGDVKLSVEGIYNKDLRSVVVTKYGIHEDGIVSLIDGVDQRTKWVSDGIKNSNGATVTPYLLENSNNNGWYLSGTVKAEKDFNFGLNLMAAYTRSASKSATDGIGDQVTSAFNTNTFNVNGVNAHELGYSSWIAPDRLIAYVSYAIDYGKHFKSTFGLYYEGYQYGYIGGYSYSRYSYTLNSSVTGDGGAYSLIYIPTRDQLNTMTFADEANKEDFWTFVNEDKYLSKHIGEYAERGGAVMPWYHTINFKFMEDFYIKVGDRTNTLQVGLDVNNLANLFNPSKGNVKQLSTNSILKYKDSTYTFTNPTWNKYASTVSTWQMLLSVRYIF